jgi:hypothetical protein
MAAITINDIGVVTKEVFVAHTTRTLLERNEVAAAEASGKEQQGRLELCSAKGLAETEKTLSDETNPFVGGK